MCPALAKSARRIRLGAMRILDKSLVCCAAVMAGLTTTAAHAQFIMLQPGTGPSASCYDGRKTPKPRAITSAGVRADKAFLDYLAFAKTPGGLKEIFLKHTFVEDRNWALDGKFMAAVDARDPWVSRISRVERTSLTVANGGGYIYRGVWNAYAEDGALLGAYDAIMQSGRGSAAFISIVLYSPDQMAKAPAIAPFCSRPGDIEFWQQEQEAKRQRALTPPR